MGLFFPATNQDELILQYGRFVDNLLCVSFLGCGVLQYIKQREKLAKPQDNTPEFDQFQRTYIGVFVCAVMSDWLKGPYIYVLYQSAGQRRQNRPRLPMTERDCLAGFDKQQIATLFMAGYVSSAVFGTVVASLVDKIGRKKGTLSHTNFLMYEHDPSGWC